MTTIAGIFWYFFSSEWSVENISAFEKPWGLTSHQIVIMLVGKFYRFVLHLELSVCSLRSVTCHLSVGLGVLVTLVAGDPRVQIWGEKETLHLGRGWHMLTSETRTQYLLAFINFLHIFCPYFTVLWGLGKRFKLHTEIWGRQ